MSSRSERFVFTLAEPSDSKELLEILEEDDFAGQISLLYTRRPDAYRSLQMEGETVLIVVCQDKKNARIAGFGACAVRELYVNGEPEKVGYLFGLRARKEYRKVFPLLAKGYDYLRYILAEKGVTLCLTSILTDNRYAQRLLEKDRPFMPAYTPYSSYNVYILKTNRQTRRKTIQAEVRDVPRLLDFLNEYGRRHQFYPVLREADLLAGKHSGLSLGDFYILPDNRGHILAAGAVWDQQAYKQYVIQGYSGCFRFLYPLSRLLPRFGYTALPEPGTVLNFFALSFWAVRDDNPDYFRTFVREIAGATGRYSFFVLGLPEQNDLTRALRGSPHLSYKSRIYLVNWDRAKAAANEPDGRPPYLECGTL